MSGWIIVQWVIVRVGNCFTRHILWARYSQEPLWFLAHIVLPYSLVHLFYNKTVEGIKAKVVCIIYLDLFVQLIQPHSLVDYSCPLIYPYTGIHYSVIYEWPVQILISLHSYTQIYFLWWTCTGCLHVYNLNYNIGFFCNLQAVQADQRVC